MTQASKPVFDKVVRACVARESRLMGITFGEAGAHGAAGARWVGVVVG